MAIVISVVDEAELKYARWQYAQRRAYQLLQELAAWVDCLSESERLEYVSRMIQWEERHLV